MIMFLRILTDEVATTIAWTIFHSLWQMSLVAILVFLILTRISKEKAALRYNVGLFGMFASVVLTAITFAYYDQAQVHTITADLSNRIFVVPGFTESQMITPLSGSINFIDNHAFVIALIWILGSFLFFTRFAGGVLYLKVLGRGFTVDDPGVTDIVQRLREHFNIFQNVDVIESSRVHSPMVFGFFKPVILFPVGLINHLSMEEVEIILLHEMAHISRNDYLVNTLQCVAETIFYYHPAMWWLSSTIRTERENCCDDLAMASMDHPVRYAKTLVKIQEHKLHGGLSPAIGFSNSPTQLKYRIMRILKLTSNKSSLREKLTAGVVLLILVFLFSNGFTSLEEIEEPGNIESRIMVSPSDDSDCNEILVDTLPQKKKYKIRNMDDHEEIEIEIVDGEVRQLKIDGQEVDEGEYNRHIDIVEDIHSGHPGSFRMFFPDSAFNFDFKFDHLDSVLSGLDDKLIKMDRFQFDSFDFPRVFKYELDSFDFPEIGTFHFDDDLFEKSQRSYDKARILMDSIIVYKLDSVREKLDLYYPEKMEELFDKLEGHRFFDDPHQREELERRLHEFKSDRGFFGERPQKVSDIISHRLSQDELIEIGKENVIELSGKNMKINGDKQPKNIWKKYRRMYEEHTGMELTKDSKIVFKTKGQKVLRWKNKISI